MKFLFIGGLILWTIFCIAFTFSDVGASQAVCRSAKVWDDNLLRNHNELPLHIALQNGGQYVHKFYVNKNTRTWTRVVFMTNTGCAVRAIHGIGWMDLEGQEL